MESNTTVVKEAIKEKVSLKVKKLISNKTVLKRTRALIRGVISIEEVVKEDLIN
jgi:hypothetical protein